MTDCLISDTILNMDICKAIDIINGDEDFDNEFVRKNG